MLMRHGRPTLLDPLAPALVLEYFQNVRQAYSQAEAMAAGLGERCFDLGGYTVRIRGPNRALLARMTVALAHLELERSASADLTICLWDSAATAPVSPLGWYRQRSPAAAVQLTNARYDARGELPAFTTERIRTSFHLWPSMLQVLDLEQNLALFWIEDGGQLPYYEAGAPFSKVLAWWLGERDRLFVHAGAVGRPAGGVLLVGPAGSGKSTSTLACLGSGLGYAGDDYCGVASDPSPRVFSLYNAAKLKGPDDLARFPRLVPLVENAERLEREKALLFLYSRYPEVVTRGFPLRALLVPCVTGAAEARLVPISAAAALRAVAPSTVQQQPGSGRLVWQKMTQLVRSLPSYRLEVGPATATIPVAIEQLLTRL